MAGTLKVDSINADSNLALKIANTAVAFIDATGLRPTSGNVSLDATATSKFYLPSANTVAIQTAGVTGLSISSSQVVTLANALPVTSGGTGVTTSTGTGAVVLGTSPVLTTPALGTPSALVLTNATGLPQAGFGTNVAGTGPAFSAYAQGNQSVSNNTWTKVALAYEEFDTNNNFNTTLYRFLPTVAGYYQINGQIGGNATVTNPTIVAAAIYKNGAIYKEYITTGNSIDYQMGIVSSIVYLNGSTDYVELYGYLRSTSAVISGESSYVITWMNGAMVRSA